MRKFLKQNRGITLIALVITIIVLLILAGISIATLAGDNGVLTKASDAKILNEIGSVKDEINLKAAEAMSDYYDSVYGNTTSSPAYSNTELAKAIMGKIKTEFHGKDYSDYTITVEGEDEGVGAKITIQSKAVPSLKTIGTMQADGKIVWGDNYKRPPQATGISFVTETASVQEEETLQLNPTIQPSGATGTISYSSSDITKATVNDLGLVTGVAEGTATITATVNGKSATIIVTVTPEQPWMPGDAVVTNDDLATGFTIKDKNQNEWVWIEVPKSVTASASLDNPTSIKEALEHYVYETNAKNETSPLLTKGTSWSSENAKTTTCGYTDVNHDGTGLTDDQYTKKYNAMLKSIKSNGGFYIGKYEVGYKNGSIRQESSKGNISNNAPVIQVDAYPYNCVTNAEAENLSEILTTGMASAEDTKGSLMFGIQWDLVLKYLNEKGGLSKADLTSNSQNWGNYRCAYNLKQTTAHGYKGSCNIPKRKITWNSITSTYTHPNGYDVLSTGATERNARLNVYDLAGNLLEWTLEKSYNNNCVIRGGYFTVQGTYPVSYRSSEDGTGDSFYLFGFRPTLY